MSLTYVCSWWRAVALAVPELWAAVSGTQDWTQSTTFGVLRVWMNNACMSSTTSGAGTVFPLDLHLAAPLPTSPDLREARRMVRVFRLFLNHVGMCRSLNLRLDKNLLRELEILLQTPSSPDVIHRHPALLLEDVEFAFPAKMSVCVDHINALIAWLNAAPALRRLRWTYFFDNERLHMEALPWHKLEEVILQCPMSFDRSLACLSQCTSAKTVFISNLGGIPLSLITSSVPQRSIT
ncbi:hypothetical protein BDZ97DRAFT_260296 [Flammula alnicola]|nr:hypothetical protein BDZ97DRAFT_260296 [Flammula alnicola]